MDPYHNPIDPEQPTEEDFGEDHLRALERELAPQTTDYYGILNVSKTATEEELKESYKKLCRFFHPDKHNNPESKKLAEAKFQVIQKAYEVLSDPTKRAIYDTYGVEGLNASWEIGTRYKTPEELREEYEKQARLKREQQLENLVRSRGEFQINLDASPVFDPYEPPIIPAFAARQPTKPARRSIFQPLTRVQVHQLFMRHSFETQVGPQTRVILGGSMLSRNGIGGGNLSGTVRHTVSPKFWTEFTATMLKPHTASLKTYYNVSSDTFVNTVSTVRTLAGPPVINVTVGRRLYATTTGYMTYRTGEWSLGGWGVDLSRSVDRSSVALGFATARKQGNYSVELQTGIFASHIAFEYTHKLLKRILLRLSAVASTTGGLTASIGSDHKITEHSRFGMSLECGVPSGVAVKFKVSRLGQKIVLPIVLSTEFDAKLAFFGAIVPVSIALTLDQLILKPRRRKQIKEKIEQLREEHAEYLATRKQEALDGQKLMREVAERKQRQEEKKKDGLVVVKALYGRASDVQQLSGDDDEELPEGVIDVTVVIQALVNESRLTIPGGYSKTNILGFYDPCLGEKKQLKVQYRFQNRLHEAIVSDSSPLICPMRSHIA